MRIGVYHNLTPGGAKRAVYEEIKSLSKKHDIFLYLLSCADESYLDIRPFCKKVNLYNFDLTSKYPGYLNRLERDFKNFVILNKLHTHISNDMDNNNLDAVLVHPDRFTQAPFLLNHLKTPSLYYCEEYVRIAYEKEFAIKENISLIKRIYEYSTRKLRKHIDKSNAKKASVVIANSRFTKSKIDAAYGITAKVNHLGVDVDVFKKTSTKKENYILFIGSKFDLEGDDLATNFLKLIPKKIRPSVKLLGHTKGKLAITNDKLLAGEYTKAIATVCVQKNEPFGLAPIESMACETPVLAIDQGGYKETIVNGKTGYLLPCDEKEFAGKLRLLIRDRRLSNKMGVYGCVHVKKYFTWQRHVQSIEKELYKIVKEKSTIV